MATSLGFAPMIAVQGFAASREIGAALVAQAGGSGWLVACWMIFTAVVSFVAFYLSKESKDVDIGSEH